jgi:D-alanine-D-alanine ligase
MSKKKIRVVVLFGGRSGEHEVSLASANGVMDALDPDHYEVLPVGITKTGNWLFDGNPMQKLLAGNDTETATTPLEVEAELVQQSGTALVATPRTEMTGAATLASADVIFPVLHGPHGEDGTVQGLFEVAGIPYVGSGVTGSAVGMDKGMMKALFANAGLPQLPYVVVTRHQWQNNPDRVIAGLEETLPYPMFVKPANLGSSVGISKVRNADDLREGLTVAAGYDRRIIVEQGLDKPREIEVAVLGNDDPEASVAGEIVPLDKYEFYDYESKYSDGQADLRIPAPISDSAMAEVRQMAVRAFQAIDAAGLSRVDFLLDRETGRFYLNEINTMPGFTPTSMYPKLWEATGVPYGALVGKLVELAIERHGSGKEK